MGNNHFGQLGHAFADNTCSISSEPQLVVALDGIEVVSIAAGNQYSMALSSDNRLFAWGRGDCGQLGLGVQAVNPVPRVCNKKIPRKIELFRCGSNMTFILTDRGDLYCTGDNSQGGLGIGDKAIVKEFTRNSYITEPLKDVRPGESHTLYLQVDGHLLVSGSNAHGQLGCPGKLYVKTPTECSYFQSANVSLIAAGDFSACVVAGRDIFLWGFSKEEDSPLRVSVSGSDLEELQMNGKTFIALDEEKKLWTFSLQGHKTVGIKTGSIESRALRCCGVGNGFWIGATQQIDQFNRTLKAKTRESLSEKKSIYRFESENSSVESLRKRRSAISGLRVNDLRGKQIESPKRRESLHGVVAFKKSVRNDRNRSSMVPVAGESLKNQIKHGRSIDRAPSQVTQDKKKSKLEALARSLVQTTAAKGPFKNTISSTGEGSRKQRTASQTVDKPNKKKAKQKEDDKVKTKKDKGVQRQQSLKRSSRELNPRVTDGRMSRSASVSAHRSHSHQPSATMPRGSGIDQLTSISNKEAAKKKGKQTKDKKDTAKETKTDKRDKQAKKGEAARNEKERSPRNDKVKVARSEKCYSDGGAQFKRPEKDADRESYGQIADIVQRSSKKEATERDKSYPLKPPSSDNSEPESESEDEGKSAARTSSDKYRVFETENRNNSQDQTRLEKRKSHRTSNQTESPVFGRRYESPKNSVKAEIKEFDDAASEPKTSSKRLFQDNSQWHSGSTDRRGQKYDRDALYDLYIDKDIAFHSKNSMNVSKSEMQEAYSSWYPGRGPRRDVVTFDSQTSYNRRDPGELNGSTRPTIRPLPLTSSNFEIYRSQPTAYHRDDQRDRSAARRDGGAHRGMGRYKSSEDKLVQTEGPLERSVPLTFQRLQSHQILSHRGSPQKEPSESNVSMGSTVRLALEGWEKERQKFVMTLEELDEARLQIANLQKEIEGGRAREQRLMETLRKLEAIVDEKDNNEHALLSELSDRESMIDQLSAQISQIQKEAIDAEEKEQYLREEIQYLREMQSKALLSPISRPLVASTSEMRLEDLELGKQQPQKWSESHPFENLPRIRSSERDRSEQDYERMDYQYRDETQYRPDSQRAWSFGDTLGKEKRESNLLGVDNADYDDVAITMPKNRVAKDSTTKPISLTGSGAVSYTNSLYPPFKHDSGSESILEWENKRPSGTGKIYGYIDSVAHRRPLADIINDNHNYANQERKTYEKKASNPKLYCEFAQTALKLMSVFGEGEGLVRGQNLPSIPSELEDKVKDIKSKYCCTMP